MVSPDPNAAGTRRVEKSTSAFRTISEVSGELDVPQHVLRFWESKFSQVRPLKRGGGRRYYRPEDIALLRRIRDLLYTEGYTIRGVQRLLREGGTKAAEPRSEQPASRTSRTMPASEQRSRISANDRRALESVLRELKELRDLLDSRPQGPTA